MSKAYEIVRYPGIERLGPEALWALVDGAAKAGHDPNALLGHIWRESGFKADARAPGSTATGLIQMVDQTARRFAGVSADQLRRMSAAEQVPGVLAYFAGVGPLTEGWQFRLLGYSRNPALLTASPSFVVYPAGSAAARGNPWVQDESGAITKKTIVQQWLEKEPQVATFATMQVSKPPGTASSGEGGFFFATIAATSVALWAILKGKKR